MTYYGSTLLSLFALSVVTRALPFFLADYMSPRINQLGKLLPAYIMMLLVIYEVGPANIMAPPYAWQAWAALLGMTLFHLWRRNTLFSLCVGTSLYLLLLSLYH